MLAALVDGTVRDTCAERESVYDTEIVSITCGPEDLPFDLSLFASLDEMAAAYTEDVAQAETQPLPDGVCEMGNFEGAYELGERIGRYSCREHIGSSGAAYHVLEWTDEDALVIGYISNLAEAHTWPEIIEFWEERVTAFAP